MQQSQLAGARSSTNGSSSTSSSSRTRRPHVWQDDMAEVKETFRRVARARHRSGDMQSSPPRVTAPMLSRNRRARIRCQVQPSGSLQVPVKVLQEIQRNRSQSPFVSLNHLQNVLGMCRRIRSQQSHTERKKNPHDPSVYPVYVRRPWSVSACAIYQKAGYPNNSPNHVSPTSEYSSSQHHAHVSPTSQHHVAHVSPAPQSVTQSAEAMSLPQYSVSPCSLYKSPHVSPNCRQRAMAHVSPSGHAACCNDPTTPLYYRPARFKPLYDISNGVFAHTQIRKRPSSLRQEKVRMCAKEKPSWTHYRQLISHPSVDDTLEVQHLVSPNPYANPNHHANPNPHPNPNPHANPNFNMHPSIPINAASLHFHPNALNAAAAAGAAHHSFPWQSPENENFIITKKPRTLRPSPMGFSESWPSSSSCFSNDHLHHLSDLQAHLKLLQYGLDCNDLDSDRRPHSENDLNLHSASYFLERPPSRCMKRPLSSSFSWRNVGDLQLGMPKSLQSPPDFGFADAWSANSSNSQQECSIFIPRDLNGNILKPHPSASTCKSTSMSFKQRYCPKSNIAGYKSTSFAGDLMDLSSRSHKVGGGQQYRSKQHVNNNTNLSSKLACAAAAKRGNLMQSYGGMKKKKKKKKPINFSSTSCLDDLEGLPPSKWAKRLASDLMMGTPCRAKSKAGEYTTIAGKDMISKASNANACFNSGFKHRVKFASQTNNIIDEGFRKEAQSLASTEISIPDLLSWERDSGLLTGEPPSANDDHVHAEDPDEEPDQQLLEQVEAMLAASSSSSFSSPSPSPYSQLMSSSSPMQLCSPARDYSMDSSWSLKRPTETRLHNADDIMTTNPNENVHHLQKSNKENGIIFQHVMGSSDIDEPLQAKGEYVMKGSTIEDNVGAVDVVEAVKDGQITEKQKEAIDVEQELIKEAIEVEPQIMTEETGKEVVDVEPNELSVRASSLISINHNTALIEAMDSKLVGVQQQDDDDDDDEEMKEPLKGGLAAAAADPPPADADQWELEKLFQDSLDLNPTLRHLYDSMSFLNGRVSPDPCSFTIS